MVDKWAPLIFINSADSGSAKLFSLLHELAHIWIGLDDLFNDLHNRTDRTRSVETICNAVAGELLVPKHIFLEKWDVSGGEDVFENIKELARFFRCSDIVVARKALDCHKIKKETYDKVVQIAIDTYNLMKENKDGSGGNYYHTMGARLDGSFVRALCESIDMGRTSYTEACRLTNTSRKTFSEVVKGLGGVA